MELIDYIFTHNGSTVERGVAGAKLRARASRWPVKSLLLQNNIQKAVCWLFEIYINMQQFEDYIMEYQYIIRHLK